MTKRLGAISGQMIDAALERLVMCATAAPCLLRRKCLRHMAAPIFRQEWADFKPGKNGRCKDRLPIGGKKP